jgi:hypothetical protein
VAKKQKRRKGKLPCKIYECRRPSQEQQVNTDIVSYCAIAAYHVRISSIPKMAAQ